MRNLKRAFHKSPLIPVHVGTPREQKLIFVEQSPKRLEPYTPQEVEEMTGKLKIYEGIDDGSEYVKD